MKKIIVLVLILLFSCDNSSGNGNKDLRVLIVTFNQTDITRVQNWQTYMPNYDFRYFVTGSVDTIPDGQLDSADVVLFFSNYYYSNSAISNGNKLYDYVNNGGNLIMATFLSFHNYHNSSTGFGNLNNLILVNYNGSHGDLDTLIVDTDHKLLRGIDQLVGLTYGGGDFQLANGGKQIAMYKNGTYFAAERDMKGKILYISVFPPEPSYQTSFASRDEDNLENFYRLWANAIRYAFSGNSSEKDFEYEEEEDDVIGPIDVKKEEDVSLPVQQ